MDLKYFDWTKHQASMRPNKVAIRDYYSGEHLTYLELEKRALKIAAYFQKKNIGNKDRVALLSRNNSIFF
jgi:fatty-acyl-CoA synthase